MWPGLPVPRGLPVKLAPLARKALPVWLGLPVLRDPLVKPGPLGLRDLPAPCWPLRISMP